MNNESRTKNSIRNSYFNITSQLLIILLNFISRSIFIKILSVDYLGVNGLFSNILTMLSLAELGVGSAIIYSMYKPIAQNDKETIRALMQLYAKAYRIIALFILIIGGFITPIIDIFINDGNSIPNLKLIYFLFLMNTVISYLFAYKKSMLSADQREYVNSQYRFIFNVFRFSFQILFLILTHSYIIYLIIQILSTFLENYYVSKKVDKMYPFLLNKNHVELSKEIKEDIFINIKSLMIYKIASVLLDGTDNLIIGKFLGSTAVGLLSNYTLIIGSITTIVSQFFNSLNASIGNMIASESLEKQEEVFNTLSFLSFWLYCFCSIALLILVNPFITLWIGEEYTLSTNILLLLTLNFYINGMLNVCWSFRTTMGLFRYGKWRPVISGILNIILSVIMVKKLGITGVLLGTTITRILTNVIYDPYLIFKQGFKKSVLNYYLKYLGYLFLLIIIFLITWRFTNYTKQTSLLEFIYLVIKVTVIPNVVMFIMFYKNKNFQLLKARFINILSN